MTDPAVTIITPTHDSSAYIRETVASVAVQEFADWEHIIVDDGSVDDTVAVVRAIAAQDHRVELVTLDRNRGPAHARNVGIEKARGRYIAFIDSDDLWEPEKLSVQLAALGVSGAPLVYSGYYRLNDATGDQRVIGVPTSIDYRGLLNATVISTVTAMYDRAVTGEVFMPDVRKRQDYGLWLRILRQGKCAHGIDKPLATLRKRTGSLSSNKASALFYTWQVYRKCERLSIARSTYHFINYAARAAIKAAG